MRTLQRAAAALIYPAILCLVVACERTDPPTQAPPRPGAMLLSSGAPASGFLLGGTAELAQDPENLANDVIVIRTDVAPFYGTVSRTVDAKVDQLDNMIEFKAWFDMTAPGKSCIGGSPRIQLAIDMDGDGESDGNAFGYFGAPPSFAGCPQETWLYEDFTGAGDIAITGAPLTPSTGHATPNEETEWDVTQFTNCPTAPPPQPPPPCPPRLVLVPPGYVHPWSEIENAFLTQFPNHRVCTVALVDDTFGAPFMSGTAYYDLFSAGGATFTNRSDFAGRGFAKGCGKPDDGDVDRDDDHDRDHDVDADDERFDHDRRERAKNGD